MRRVRRSKIPLRYRLPNGAPTFVGREHEVAWFREAIERAPLVLVGGPGGIGKTTFVLHALATLYPEAIDHTVFIAVRPDEPADQVRLNVAHVLAMAAGARDDVDIAGMRGDPEEIAAAALDMAEEGPFWVVIDDIQHSDAQEMGEFVRQLAAYARKSRWIITTRALELLPAFEGQSIDLPSLSPTTLAELAQHIDPRRETLDVQAAISASAGSPWLLKQYLAAGDEGLALTRAGVMDSLSRVAQEFLRTLSVIESTQTPEVLAAVTMIPPSDEIDRLVRRGLTIKTPTGYAVHDLVSDLLFPPSDDAANRAWRAQVATALSALDDPDAVLEGLRLHHADGSVDALVKLLEVQGHELLALGYAPRIWSVVGSSTDERLRLWQLRCAAELGNSTVLAAVHAPALHTDSDQLAWAMTQYLLGEPAEARVVANGVATATADAHVRTRARLLSARCLIHLGDPSEAARELRTIAPAEGLTFAHAALGLVVDSCLDVAGTALRAASLLSGAPPELDQEALLDVATAFFRAGERAQAEEVIKRVLATPRGGRASLLVARRAMLLQARISLERADGVETERLLELVRPYARGVSILCPLLIEIDAARSLTTGDLIGLGPMLARGIELARQSDVGVMLQLSQLADDLRLRSEPNALAGVNPDAVVASLWETRASRRLRTTLGVARTLIADADPSALDMLRTVHRDASRMGLGLLAVDALLLLADGLLAAMHMEELTQVAIAIADVGESFPSPRLLHHAAFYESYGEVASLERLASAIHVAPVVARRARALLGATVEEDDVDRRVLAAARAAWAGRQVVTLDRAGKSGSADVSTNTWAPAWGLDTLRHELWLPDGRVVSLKRKPLSWRILSVLASHDSATKEALINEAWGEPDYHPLRHDPKLHVAVRTLRNELEEDPSMPTRLLTTESGYALGGPVRLVIAET